MDFSSVDSGLAKLECIDGYNGSSTEMVCLKKLLAFETNIDKMLSKKRLDIQEMLAKPQIKIKAVLRIHVYAKFFKK